MGTMMRSVNGVDHELCITVSGAMGVSRDKNERFRRMRTVRGVNPPSWLPGDEAAVVERRRRLGDPNNVLNAGFDVPTPRSPTDEPGADCGNWLKRIKSG